MKHKKLATAMACSALILCGEPAVTQFTDEEITLAKETANFIRLNGVSETIDMLLQGNLLGARFCPEKTEGYAEFVSGLKVKREAVKGASYEAKKEYLEENLLDIFSYWYGTKWNFYGMTTEPNSGSVACGHFVSTTLSHLGYRFNRQLMGQQAALRIIKSFCKGSAWINNEDDHFEDLENHIKKNGPGIYIVGLQCHVGFLHYDGKDLSFIHSNYLPPVKVMKERAAGSQALRSSNIFAVGKLFSPEFTEKYFSGTYLPVSG